MSNSARDELRKARLRYEDLGIAGNGVTVRIPDTSHIEQARAILRKIDPDATLQETGDGQFRLSLTEDTIRQRKSAAVEQSLEIIRRRIDETGVREPSIQRQGVDRILVQLPGIDDPRRIKALIGKTAKMTFHLLDEQANLSESLAGRAPPGSMVLPMLDRHASPGQQRRVVVQRRVMVSGENLIDAQPTFQQNEPVVSFRFDAAGGRRFGEATSQNVGKHLAIVLDDQVISAPQIREPILGGSGVITGGFSVAEAQDLALLLRAGALPAPLTVLEERTVGPGLGADSIQAGKTASIVGVVLVVAFMVLSYGLFGVFANIGLVAHVVLILAAMSVLGATLTLPGIAGIVLTIGMAVDANVLIYEHIREEVRAGRTPVSAIELRLYPGDDDDLRHQPDHADRGYPAVHLRIRAGARFRRNADDRYSNDGVYRRHRDPLACRYLAAPHPAARFAGVGNTDRRCAACSSFRATPRSRLWRCTGLTSPFRR